MRFQASFSQKIIGTLSLLILFFMGTLGFVAYEVLTVKRQSESTVSNDIPQLIRLANFRYNILQVRRAEKDISIDLAMRPEGVVKRTENWNKLNQVTLEIVDEAVKHASGESLAQLQQARVHFLAYWNQSKKAVSEVASKSTLEMAIFETDLDAAKKEIRQAEEIATEQITSMRKVTDAGAVALAADIRLVWWTAGVGLAVTLITSLIAGLTLLRSLSVPVAALGRGIEKVRGGDLKHVVSVTSGDELGAMSTAFNEMVADLRNTVGNVRDVGESVANASAEIAQGNNDLSARTEQQASALQETAAAMEQLSGTVKKTADNAKEANRQADSASEFASMGGSVVGEVIATMKGIEDSSNKIASIIQVIDGIAFQTNILALNAAVEAARAGEQGRGFAVVASEVRSLAGRSASAAKEIKTLISTSSERVSAGSALVERAGHTMTEVVGAVKLVSQLMASISIDSREQSIGVNQVGEAVSQMDTATQQNAALVEEIAAAAASLKTQSHELVEAVSVFNIGHAGSASQASSSGAYSPRRLTLSA